MTVGSIENPKLKGIKIFIMYLISNCFNHSFRWAVILISILLFTSPETLSGQDIKKSLLGTWTMVSNGDGFLEATIHFQDGNKYQLIRKWPDTSVAEIKGGYELDASSTPARLRLCLADCNAAGSEWTSMFCACIMEEPNQLRIQISDSGEYPDSVSENPDDQGMYLFERSE